MTEVNYIFISYKSEQREIAFEVRDQLHALGYETWLDHDQLQPGSYWANEIDSALKNCMACVGLMTPLSIQSRFVTNEWDTAIRWNKLFIPLMFEPTETHYKYIDIQYIDFTSNRTAAYAELKHRLEIDKKDMHQQIVDDLYVSYLQNLYDRINQYLSAKLITSLHTTNNDIEPINLTMEKASNAVDVLFAKRDEIDPLFVIGGITKKEPQEFHEFAAAFEFYDARVLLMGQPGAGKTITLLHFARDAVIKRMRNSSAPLPILGIIPSWDPYTDIIAWLSTTYGAPPNAKSIILEGSALLLLDGLDELPNSIPIHPNSPEQGFFNPKIKFVEQVPENNQILLTSRQQEYLSLEKKIRLRGAITLKPLANRQLQQYLHAQPELLNLIESDRNLRNWLNTPLLLSFFAFVYEDLSDENKQKLESIEDQESLRNFILERYIHDVFHHELHKLNSEIMYSLDELHEALGAQAIFVNHNMSKRFGSMYSGIPSVYEANQEDIVELSVRLGIGSYSQNHTFQFIHLYLQDYFAKYFVTHLNQTNFIDWVVSNSDFEFATDIQIRESIKFWVRKIVEGDQLDFVIGLRDLSQITYSNMPLESKTQTSSTIILHIEDSLYARRESQKLLSRVIDDPYLYVGADSGAVGLILAYLLKPTLIITDINHGAVNGVIMAQYLRQITDVPIIVWSGDDKEIHRVELSKLASINQIVKGEVDYEEIISILQSFLSDNT